MAGIIVYSMAEETHENEFTNFNIDRGSILCNPYTDKPVDGIRALYRVKTLEEALEKYDTYFDMMYGGNKEFKDLVDQIYLLYKYGDTVYLGCWCKDVVSSHGKIIKQKLEQRLIREKFEKIRNKKCR